MDNDELVDHIVNAIGNDHFKIEDVMQALKEKIDDMQAQGRHTGSMLALANMLPEIAEEAKTRY